MADNNTQNLPTYFTYVKGARYMCTYNFAVEVGGSNGAIGTGDELVLHPDEPPDSGEGDAWYLTKEPRVVLLLMDDGRLGAQPLTADIGVGVLPVEPITAFDTFGIPGGGRVLRRQIPLVPAFCLTDMKYQGTTCGDGFIADLVTGDRTGMKFANVYVPISRSTTLEGLAFLRPFDVSALSKLRPNNQMLMDCLRLTRLSEHTLAADFC
jgi:hypothetical protein